MFNDIMQALIDAVHWLFGLLFVVIRWLLDGILYVVMGCFYLILSGLLYSLYALVSAISFSSVVFQWTAGWAGVPAGTIYFVTACKLPEAVTIVSAAIIVRMLLNLVPGAVTRV